MSIKDHSLVILSKIELTPVTKRICGEYLKEQRNGYDLKQLLRVEGLLRSMFGRIWWKF